MFTWLTDFLNSFSTAEVAVTVVCSYLFIEFYFSYNEELQTTLLLKDFNDTNFLWNFYYENASHEIFFFNRSIFYDICVGRSMWRRMHQDYIEYKVVTPYDFRSYTPRFDRELKFTHNIKFSYPEYFETYINLKYQLICSHLHSLWHKENFLDSSKGIRWFINLPKDAYKPPIIKNNFWKSDAESIQLIYILEEPINLLFIWLIVFIIVIIIFFFKNLQFRKL